MISSDYLLLLLYLNDNEPIRGAVRLTKMMFLFEKQIIPILKKGGTEIIEMPEFIAYNYGPFSKELYEQIDLFTAIGFIYKRDLNAEDSKNLEEMCEVDDIEENEFVDECYENENEFRSENYFWEYSITDKGKSFVEKELLSELNSVQRDLLERFKRQITSMTIKQLLYYVYTRYPEYTEKSLIKRDVLE